MTLEQELATLLNRHSQENASNTPDFILAQYLLGCITAWNTAVQQRETWHGRDARPTLGLEPKLKGEESQMNPTATKEEE